LPKIPAKPASILASSATYEALINTSPAWVELSSVIFSTPTTSTKRALPAASVFSPMWIAAEPVAQGILDPRAGLEAEVRVRLQGQRGMKLLAHEAAIHVADIDDVDVLGFDAGVGNGLAGGLHDQRFAGLAIELAELAVRPSDDTGSHGTLLRYEPRFWRATLDAAAWRVESGSTCIYTYIAWPSSQPSPQEICSWRPGYRLGPAQIPPLDGY